MIFLYRRAAEKSFKGRMRPAIWQHWAWFIELYWILCVYGVNLLTIFSMDLNIDFGMILGGKKALFLLKNLELLNRSSDVGEPLL